MASFSQGAGTPLSLTPSPGGVQKTPSFPPRALSFENLLCSLRSQSSGLCVPISPVLSCLLTILGSHRSQLWIVFQSLTFLLPPPIPEIPFPKVFAQSSSYSSFKAHPLQEGSSGFLDWPDRPCPHSHSPLGSSLSQECRCLLMLLPFPPGLDHSCVSPALIKNVYLRSACSVRPWETAENKTKFMWQ